MKVELFKSGVFQQRYQYRSFEPSPIDVDWAWEDVSINVMLDKANRALGELNAFSLIVPDINLFLRMHVLKEAQTSSKIEGTQTTINEALLPESEVNPERRNDWREVQNYISAMNKAIQRLEILPISNRLLKETHAILMQGVRGEKKMPGEYRISQNWIGGSSLDDAVFVPPHHEGVPDLMSDLERFLNNRGPTLPPLFVAAISHYQFETIHPFLDGNGRIGRLLIPLYLIGSGTLSKPSLYLSDFFERNRASYYDALMRVRMSNDLSHWLKFFLQGVFEVATKGRNTFREILDLRHTTTEAVHSLGKRSPNGLAALNYLFESPSVTAASLQDHLGVSQPTANKLLDDLERLGIVREVTGRLRDKIYVFDRYLALFTK